jgi:hypothetical protein
MTLQFSTGSGVTGNRNHTPQLYPFHEPKVTEPKVTKPKVTEPKVTEPTVTEPT